MNLLKKKEQLVVLINRYLNGLTSCQQMQEFAWEIVNYFSSKDASKLSPYHNFEKEFWFAVWQIIHLADEEHEKDNLTRKKLTKALSYLRNESKMPCDYIGKRP